MEFLYNVIILTFNYPILRICKSNNRLKHAQLLIMVLQKTLNILKNKTEEKTYLYIM